MIKNFPTKYFIIFTDSIDNKLHKNKIIAGLRLSLTLIMNEYDVTIMLLEESAKIAHKKFQSENNDEQKNKESKKISKDIEDKQFSATELLEGFIAFGGITYTCKSSLELSGMEKEDLIKGIEIETLHNAVLLMEECDKILCF